MGDYIKVKDGSPKNTINKIKRKMRNWGKIIAMNIQDVNGFQKSARKTLKTSVTNGQSI